MRILISLVLCFIISDVFTQDTLYFDSYHKRIDALDASNNFEVRDFDKVTGLYKVSKYQKGKIESVYHENPKTENKEGLFIKYDSLGNTNWTKQYVAGELHGELISYYPDGSVKRKDKYIQGELESGSCFDESGKEIEYFDFEVMPRYPGGNEALLQFIYDKLKYPKSARENGIEGFVVVQFQIDKNGNIIEPKVVKQPSKDLGIESMRIIKELQKVKWIPGKMDGENVKVLFTLPLKFSLK